MWQHRRDRAALATANRDSRDKTTANSKNQLRNLKFLGRTGLGSEKPLTVGSFIKTPISGQLNNNCHVLFRKRLLQYGCHDLLCQVWAGLSRMQSLCVHKFPPASKTIQPAGSAAAVTMKETFRYWQRLGGFRCLASAVLE